MPSPPVEPAGLAELWKDTLGDPAITIALLDGPVDTSHPSLAAAAITQMDFIGSRAVGGAAREHGTHTASIIFGQHDGPVKGIAPLCRGMIVPIFRCDPHGRITPCSQPDLARAIRMATNAGANVINVSAGQFSSCGTGHPMLADAVQACADDGRLIVAAAGNDGCECLRVPGALPSVLAVGAMDEDGNPMDFSNWGEVYRTSGILAPGVNVLGAIAGDGVGPRSGTSFSAPIVSGVAGLLLSLQRKQGRQPDAKMVRAAILESALGCEHRQVPDCRRLLAGRLNVSGATSRILQGETIMSDSPTETIEAGRNVATQETAAQCPREETIQSADRDTRRSRLSAAAGDVPVNEPSAADDESMPQSPSSRSSERPNAAGRSPRRAVQAAVAASECACQQNGELVYAIGDLDIDFGTLARLDSIQQNADSFNGGGRLDVRINGYFLRHLLGWREDYIPKDKSGKPAGDAKVEYHRPHMYDADAVIWVLRQDESPVYAIRPTGAYTEDAYLELAKFLMEQEGYPEDPMSHHEPREREPHKGENEPELAIYPSLQTEEIKDEKGRVTGRSEPHRETTLRGDPVRIVERVAIPGRMNGTVELMNGMVIPVIDPDMRGTRSWSMPALVKLHCTVDPESAEDAENRRLMRNLERIAQRFFEEVRNAGLAPEDRALNFAATQIFRFVPFLKDRFGENVEPELDSITVQPSPTCRQDSECYDVETAFFDPENVLRAKTVLARTIDVSDVVPVMLGEEREYRRR